ncbi:response regulator [Mesoterricola sediminis]|uniref:histidine kinase n=1 Tax=Mesoterricola sediminis TaxID=2927980 RepID=A0AA48H4F4_9BACT|nr:ATP-binding protein [Mesoterricola sediminis]BDU75793.1 hypothetical protein METESE_07510 [Mesoterricola sediminis]
MNRPTRILYLEDQPLDVELVKATLASDYVDCDLAWVNGRDAYLSALQDPWNYDVLLVDYSLPDIGGDEALEIARRTAPDLPFIFLSGHIGDERAVECLRRGATDYVLKTNLPRLAPVVSRALEEAREAAARKAAEASHARVAALLRAALESTSEGILVVDLAGRISAYNRKFLSMCGIPEFVMAPMQLDGVVQYLDGQFGDASALLEEVRLLKNQSDREAGGVLALPGNRTIRESSRPHKIGPETVGRVLSFQEAAPRETPQELLKGVGGGRSAFTAAALAARIVPWVLQGERVIMPDAGPGILGLEKAPEDLADLVALLHPDDVRFFQEALERSLNVGFSARMRRRDGSWVWTRWSVDRGMEGYRGSIQEIVEEAWRRDRELERRQMAGARLATQALAWRTLGPLQDALEALRELRSGKAEPAALDRATNLLETAAATLAQARDLAAQDLPAAQPLDPDLFMERFLPMARILAGPECPVSFQPAGNLPPVALDPAQMRAALGALVENAREAMGGRGPIRLATRLLFPRAHRPGSLPGPMRTRVILEVQDEGPGIPPALRERVLEPFFTTGPDAQRGGLGLTRARETALAHGGSLQLDCPPEGGTAVRILLPALA